VKLADFGLTQLTSEMRGTRLRGSAMYMAPELFVRDPEATAQAVYQVHGVRL
jgi:serine/threonine protein kinase